METQRDTITHKGYKLEITWDRFGYDYEFVTIPDGVTEDNACEEFEKVQELDDWHSKAVEAYDKQEAYEEYIWQGSEERNSGWF